MLIIKKEYFNENNLLKYGFRLSPITKSHYINDDNKIHITIGGNQKINFMGNSSITIDKLYDMISDGIIEKVPYILKKRKLTKYEKDLQNKIDEAILIYENDYYEGLADDMYKALKGDQND